MFQPSAGTEPVSAGRESPRSDVSSHGGKQNRASRARTMALVIGVRVGSAGRKQMDCWPGPSAD